MDCGKYVLVLLRLGSRGAPGDAQQKLRMLRDRRRRRQHQQAATEAALQSVHSGGTPVSIIALYLDHLSGMVAQQHRQLRTLRLVTLMKHDDRDLQLRIDVDFQGAARDGDGQRVLLGLSVREYWKKQNKNGEEQR